MRNLAVFLSKPCVPNWNHGAPKVHGSHSLTNLWWSSPSGAVALHSAPRGCCLSCLLHGSFSSSLSYELPFIWISLVCSLLFPPCFLCWPGLCPVYFPLTPPAGIPLSAPGSPFSLPTSTHPLRTSRDELQIENPRFESICVSSEGLFAPMQMLCSGNNV